MSSSMRTQRMTSELQNNLKVLPSKTNRTEKTIAGEAQEIVSSVRLHSSL